MSAKIIGTWRRRLRPAVDDDASARQSRKPEATVCSRGRRPRRRLRVGDRDRRRSRPLGLRPRHAAWLPALVAELCAGAVGAVFCIEASRLARNGRDWHHLVDLCALTGALVIDPDGVYDPRLMNDRLLLGLKGTMSEYELSLLRQRPGRQGQQGRPRRAPLHAAAGPGLERGRAHRARSGRTGSGCHPARVRQVPGLGSARQVFLWVRDAALQLPVVRRNGIVRRIEWRKPAYHSIVQVLHNPLYAGAYAFGPRRADASSTGAP